MTFVPHLELLDAARIRLWWPTIREGVERASDYHLDGILPEDVFGALMAGNAGCYAGFHPENEHVMEAFIICRKIESFGKAELLIWLAWHPGTIGLAKDYWPQIEDIASELGCSRITIESPRPYDRAIPGAILAYHTYHFEVGHGRRR